MKTTKTTAAYDDHNIPEIDLPKPADASAKIPREMETGKNSGRIQVNEDERPRQDGPGGN